MKKKTLNYSDLSSKQLQKIKEYYIQKKVDSMNNKELKEFVLEIIGHQINETIGIEEETEAWKEMSDFFGEEFEIIILDIKQKFKDKDQSDISETDPQKERQEYLDRNKNQQEKKDMWDD